MSALSSVETMFLYCPTCARDSLTEAPPCADGHGDCCPERVCLDCGTALLAPPIPQLLWDAYRRAGDEHRARRVA